MSDTWYDLGYRPVSPENLFRKEVKLSLKQREEKSRQARDRALKEYNEKYNTQNI